MKLSRHIPAGIVSLFVGLGLFAGLARAEDSLWKSDFEAAKTQAKAEKKMLLVDFTGSDWCIWCKRLKGEVFDLDGFKNVAPKQFVLVELDFPNDKSKISKETQEQNAKLAKEYKIQGYPTILLMDGEGKVIAHTGYRPNGPEKYMEHLGDLQKTWESVLKLKAELDGVQGLDRAKLLDQIVDAYENKLNNPSDELQTWGEEIIKLDSDNKAGLKNKYLCRAILADAEKLAATRKFAEAVAALGKALALEGLTGEQKQDVLFKQAMYQFNLKEFAAALESMTKASEAAPESEQAAEIKGRMGMLKMIVDSQASITKDQEGLAKAEGLDRAKLMDKLIQANAKLQMYGAAKLTPAEITKWTAEIVELDADNKAGLKIKYEFTKFLGEASTLARDKKFDEGIAVIDKALALDGITPEQKQEGLMAKGTNYLMQKDFEKSLESFKKALEAAPQGPRANVINFYISNIEQQQKAAEKAKQDETKEKEKS
jgi:thioredoxin-related protein